MSAATLTGSSGSWRLCPRRRGRKWPRRRNCTLKSWALRRERQDSIPTPASGWSCWKPSPRRWRTSTASTPYENFGRGSRSTLVRLHIYRRVSETVVWAFQGEEITQQLCLFISSTLPKRIPNWRVVHTKGSSLSRVPMTRRVIHSRGLSTNMAEVTK